MDNTLIPYGQGRASDKAIAAIRYAQAVPGLTVGPVSGRTTTSMSWMFGEDALDCCQTGVFVNGQVVRVAGEVVREAIPDWDSLNDLAEFLGDFPEAALTIYDNQDDDNNYCVCTTVEEMARFHCFDKFHHAVDHLPEGSYLKTNVHCDGGSEHIHWMRDTLREKFPKLDFIFPTPDAPVMDIVPAGVDKMEGLRCLMSELGVELDEVCVFGDSENDLAVIEGVPNSVAVANAIPVVADAARWHIGPATDDAVADALVDIADSYRAGTMPSFMR